MVSNMSLTTHIQEDVSIAQNVSKAEDVEHRQKSGPDTEQEKRANQPSTPPPRSMRGINWALLCVAVMSAQFLYALDNTIVADIQPSIVEDLGEIEKLPWIVVAFELGAVSANLLWGQVYGLFDNKILFLGSILLFEIGSALCGAAPNMNTLIVGRVICGLGGHGIYTGVMSTISVFTALQERQLYMSYAGAAWCIGIVLGPIIGGAFVDSSASWRWAFYINICVGGAMLPIYLFLLPSYKPVHGMSMFAKLKRIDIAGTILFIGAFTTGIIGISFGGTVYPWNSANTIGLLVCSCTLWVFFCIHQAIIVGKETRLFPIHLLHSWEMWILFAQTSSSIAMLFIELYFVPLYFQFVQGDSALQAGVRILPMIFVGLFFSVIGAGVMGKIGWYMPWYLGGSIIALIGASLLRTVDASTSLSIFQAYTIVLAAGIGCFVQASLTIVQTKASTEDIAAAVAFVGCAQLSGLALSFAFAYSIFLNTATNQIAVILPAASAATVQAAIAGVGSQAFAALPPELKLRILQAVENSFGYVYDQVLAGAAFSLVLALFMKRERLFAKI